MMTQRQSEPRAVGCTHASSVMPVVRSRLFASGTVTQLLVPLKLSAPPNLPAAVCVAPVIAPALPWPEESAAGVPALTVSVTVIVFGDPVAPVAVTVTSVVYVPAARPVIEGVTVIVPVFVPLAGDTLSHVALSDAVQSIDPPPVLLTDSVLAAGSEPPAVAEKDRLAGWVLGGPRARVAVPVRWVV